MKKLFLLLCLGVWINADAQDVVGKKSKKKRGHKSQTTVVNATPDQYKSRNGTMKVHEMGDKERIDSIQTADVDAPHVNKNYNENMPPLSPSNGSK